MKREVEKFKECRMCGGSNTKEIGSSDDYWKISYIGWCLDCRDEYGYAAYVDTVWDRKDRI